MPRRNRRSALDLWKGWSIPIARIFGIPLRLHVMGQILALALASVGLATRNAWLGILAGVVFVGAMHQARAERGAPSSRVRWAREAMITGFEVLYPDDLLTFVAQQATENPQQEFPVVDREGRLRGVLLRHSVFHGIQEHGPDARVADAMDQELTIVGPQDDLRLSLTAARANDRQPILVVDDKIVVGMIPASRVREYAAIDALRATSSSGDTVADSTAQESGHSG